MNSHFRYTQPKKVLITPSSELFQTNQEDIFKSLEIEPNKDLDEYELFQFSQNLTNFKSLLDFVSDDISINVIDFNSCKETFSELQKIEEDSFNNLQKFFSLKVSKMKSRYVDALLEINRYETMFYAKNDLENISQATARRGKLSQTVHMCSQLERIRHFCQTDFSDRAATAHKFD